MCVVVWHALHSSYSRVVLVLVPGTRRLGGGCWAGVVVYGRWGGWAAVGLSRGKLQEGGWQLWWWWYGE